MAFYYSSFFRIFEALSDELSIAHIGPSVADFPPKGDFGAVPERPQLQKATVAQEMLEIENGLRIRVSHVRNTIKPSKSRKRIFFCGKSKYH